MRFVRGGGVVRFQGVLQSFLESCRGFDGFCGYFIGFRQVMQDINKSFGREIDMSNIFVNFF